MPSQRERFLQELVHKKYIAQANVATIEQELISLYESICEEQKEKTNRAIQNVLYAYKDIAASTGMNIKEIIQKAAQQQNATDDMIIYREIPVQTLIKYARTQKPLSKTTQIAPLSEQTTVPIVIGGQQGSSVATLLHNHTGQPLAPEIINILHTIRLSDTIAAEHKRHIGELIQQTLKQTKGQARAFAKALYRTLDTKEDVLYNLADKEGLYAYEHSERFRKSGLTKAQLGTLVQRATQSITVQHIPTQEYEKTIQPVYRVKENTHTPTIHTTGIPPHVYPIAQTVYETHRQNGTLDALIASCTGTRNKAVTKTVERTVAVPFGQSAPAASGEDAALMQATQGAAQPAHGDAESRTRAAGTAESASEATVPQAHTNAKSAQHTAEHSPAARSPALSATDKEKLRMARINANYEHDKKLLAKTDPLFAKNRFWDVGHAQESGDMSEREIEKLSSDHGDDLLEQIKGIQL